MQQLLSFKITPVLFKLAHTRRIGAQSTRGGATPGPGRSYALPLKNWDLVLGPACDILIKYKA